MVSRRGRKRKKEHTSFEVPTLHVHETIDPRTIIEAVRKRNGKGLPVQPSLFERPEEKLPLRDAIDFYKHAHGWSNRLIAGDSLLVMNSLLEKEGMAGQVQMVYGGGVSNTAFLDVSPFVSLPIFTHLALGAASGPSSVVAADLNSDGKLDLISLNIDAFGRLLVEVRLGNGDGSFHQPVAYQAGLGMNQGSGVIATGDFNLDGKLDVAVADTFDNTISVLSGSTVLTHNVNLNLVVQ